VRSVRAVALGDERVTDYRRCERHGREPKARSKGSQDPKGERTSPLHAQHGKTKIGMTVAWDLRMEEECMSSRQMGERGGKKVITDGTLQRCPKKPLNVKKGM